MTVSNTENLRKGIKFCLKARVVLGIARTTRDGPGACVSPFDVFTGGSGWWYVSKLSGFYFSCRIIFQNGNEAFSLVF